MALPSRLTSLGDYAFYNCESLQQVSFPGTLSVIPDACFTKCRALTRVIMPAGITTIKWAAFSQTGITSIQLPTTLTTIGLQAFEYTPLTSVVVPQGVTFIDNFAFGQCVELTSVHLPASLTSIAEDAFSGDNKLMNVRCDRAVPPTLSKGVFSDATLRYADLQIPQNSFDLYRTAAGWKDFQWFNRAGVEEIKADGSALPVSYYDLNGRPVDLDSNPLPGIYLRKQGTTVTKVVR